MQQDTSPSPKAESRQEVPSLSLEALLRGLTLPQQN